MSGAFAWIDEKYKGEDLSRRQRRTLSNMRIKSFLVVAAAMKTATEQTKKALVIILEDYKTECNSVAMGPSAPGKEPVGRKLGTQADWLTEVHRGVTISYACRFGICTWYGRNDQWIADELLSHC